MAESFQIIANFKGYRSIAESPEMKTSPTFITDIDLSNNKLE
jgi:hypothetical protein